MKVKLLMLLILLLSLTAVNTTAAWAATPPAPPQPLRIMTHTYEPHLEKLSRYKDGAYTDGYTTYIFEEDGTVLCKYTDDFTIGCVHTFPSRQMESAPAKPSAEDDEALQAAIGKASRLVGYEDDMAFQLIHQDGDTYYLHFDHTRGGGSGESYYHAGYSYFVRVNGDEAADYGPTRAVHMLWHEGYFYYVALDDGILGSAGTGKIIRMDRDGKHRQVLVGETTFGPFQLIGDRIYYTALADGKAYSIDLFGADKQPVGSRVAPDYHRLGLAFYGDLVINNHWQNHGNGYYTGVWTGASDFAAPAIMDRNGLGLVTFPPELCGEDAYTVVNYGLSKIAHRYPGGGQETADAQYLFLQSHKDGSYWVYYAKPQDDPLPGIFEYVRQQYEELNP